MEQKIINEAVTEKLERAKEVELFKNVDRASDRMLEKEVSHYRGITSSQDRLAEAQIADYKDKPEELVSHIRTGRLTFSGYLDNKYSVTLSKAQQELEKSGQRVSQADIKEGIFNRLETEKKIEGGVALPERLAQLDNKTLTMIEGGGLSYKDSLVEMVKQPKQELVEQAAMLEQKDIEKMSPGEQVQFLKLMTNIGILDRVSYSKTLDGVNISEVPERFGKKIKIIIEIFLKDASAGNLGKLSLIIQEINKLSKSGLVPKSTLKAVVENYVKQVSNTEITKNIKSEFVRRGMSEKKLTDDTTRALTEAEYEFGKIYQNAYGAVEAEVLTEEELQGMITTYRR